MLVSAQVSGFVLSTGTGFDRNTVVWVKLMEESSKNMGFVENWKGLHVMLAYPNVSEMEGCHHYGENPNINPLR